MSVAILPMTEQYGYTDVQKGQIASAFSVGYCISQLPSGTLAALTSPKSVLLGGLVVWSAAQAASPAAAAAGLPVLLGMRAVMGAGEAAAVPSLQAVAAKFVPAKRRSLFWGVLSASLSCGTIASYLVAPPLIAEYGWEFVFVAFGACGVVLAALWAVLGASEPALALGTATAAPVAAATTTAPAPAPAAPAKKPKLSDVPWGDVVRSRPVWALTVSHASHNFFMYFGFSWLPTYFNYQFGMDTAAASSASLLPFIAGGIGSLSAGAACDLLQSELGVTRTNARKILQSIACAGPAVAMLILAALGEGLVPGVELTRDAAEVLFVTAIGLASCSAAGFGCGAQDISTRFSSLIYGASSVFAVVAGASAQYFTGVLLEANGRDFNPIFLVTSGVEVLGVLAFCSWWSSERQFD